MSEPDVATEEELDRLIADLEASYGKIPRAVILRARQIREAIVPRLIATIRHGIDEIRAGKEFEGQTPFFALFLLTELRAREALPTIVEAIELPGIGPFDVFGDAITEKLDRLLATLARDRLDLIEPLLVKPDVNMSVRIAVAEVYSYLVRDGVLEREAVLECFRQHLRRSIDRQDIDSVSVLVDALCNYCPIEARAEIDEAYRLELVDLILIHKAHLTQSYAGGWERARERLARLDPTSFDDMIAEFERWGGFDQDEPPKPTPKLKTSTFSVAADPPTLSSRVGRNDPCPCGSGKKFKKCCGKNV